MASKKKSKKHYQKQGKKNREKGKRYERNCAKALKEVFPNARRLFGQARKGCDAPDIGGTPYWIECGAGGTTMIQDKLRQGLRDTTACEDPRYTKKIPIAMTRTSRDEHIVSMYRDDFITLMKRLEAAWEILERN